MNLAIILLILGLIHPGLMTAAALGVSFVYPSFGLAFLAGFWLGIFINAQMLLPLVYAFPKSIYLFVKKQIAFKAILMALVSPVVWQTVLIALFFIFNAFAPRVNEFLMSSHGYNLGWLTSALSLIVSTFFTVRGRMNAREDYRQSFEIPYGKLQTYDDKIALTCPSCKIMIKVKPFEEEETTIRCTGCGHVFTVKKNYRGF